MVTEKAKRVLSQLSSTETKNAIDTLVYLKAVEKAKAGIEAGTREELDVLAEDEIDDYLDNVGMETMKAMDERTSFQEAYSLGCVIAESKIDWYNTKESRGR